MYETTVYSLQTLTTTTTTNNNNNNCNRISIAPHMVITSQPTDDMPKVAPEKKQHKSQKMMILFQFI